MQFDFSTTLVFPEAIVFPDVTYSAPVVEPEDVKAFVVIQGTVAPYSSSNFQTPDGAYVDLQGSILVDSQGNILVGLS